MNEPQAPGGAEPGNTPESVPLIAIAGRPNAGKSTLFNRLLGRRRAIVHDRPGVTRDEVRERWRGETGEEVELADTGGIDETERSARGSLDDRVRERSRAVLREASCIIYVLDGQAGLSPADVAMAREIRATGRPLLFAVNKIDHPGHGLRLADFEALGAGELHPVSAEHGRGIEELWDAALAIVGRLPRRRSPMADDTAPRRGRRGRDRGARPERETARVQRGAAREADDLDARGPARPPRVALFGRPNAGKSSILNRWAGFERVLVDSTPGTTRDAIDLELEVKGRRLVVVDTAGLRRPSRIVEDVESRAAKASLDALGRADVAVLVLDATQGVSDQDLRLADLVWRRGRALVVAVNKVDLMPDLDAERAQAILEERLPQWPPLAVVRVSATQGTGLGALVRAIEKAAQGFRLRIATARLNGLIASAVEAHPPPLVSGRSVKILYATQVRSAPPEVALFAGRAAALAEPYRRYLVNHLRRELALVGVPLRLSLRERRGTDDPERARARGEMPRAAPSARPKSKAATKPRLKPKPSPKPKAKPRGKARSGNSALARRRSGR